MKKENKKILFISYSQYGHLTDHYKISNLLSEYFEIDFLCLNENKIKIQSKNVNVIYIDKSKRLNILNFTYNCLKHLKHHKGEYSLIFVVHFQLAFILPLILFKNKWILDIRTLSVHKSCVLRTIKNLILFFTTFCYKHITVIDAEIAKKIFLKKYHVLPLGSDKIGFSIKNFEELNLLYIGTLNNRNLEVVIDGIKLFLDLNKTTLSFDILGSGTAEEVGKIEKAIIKNNLEDIVSLHGWVAHKEAEEYFKKCNVGVSFVPINNYFNNQPPTKLFEYARSGLVVIGTSTKATKKIMNSKIGIMCNDDSKSFSEALLNIKMNNIAFDSLFISNYFNDLSWENIVKKNLLPYIKNIINV
jgi:hypothetical protein